MLIWGTEAAVLAPFDAVSGDLHSAPNLLRIPKADIFASLAISPKTKKIKTATDYELTDRFSRIVGAKMATKVYKYDYKR